MAKEVGDAMLSEVVEVSVVVMMVGMVVVVADSVVIITAAVVGVVLARAVVIVVAATVKWDVAVTGSVLVNARTDILCWEESLDRRLECDDRLRIAVNVDIKVETEAFDVVERDREVICDNEDEDTGLGSSNVDNRGLFVVSVDLVIGRLNAVDNLGTIVVVVNFLILVVVDSTRPSTHWQASNRSTLELMAPNLSPDRVFESVHHLQKNWTYLNSFLKLDTLAGMQVDPWLVEIMPCSRDLLICWRLSKHWHASLRRPAVGMFLIGE
jgi:hypothetical protein